MRMLMTVRFPNPEFNAAVKNGNVTKIMNRILEDCGPEAVYFTEEEGQRTAMLVVNVEEASMIPRLAEPWFLAFNARVELSIAMTPEDLRKSGIDDLGRKWG
ncbi:MAG: panthothenate synthetase [Geobacteraceae bacterium GWC2_58_44]|nr:MAG: panthothenate synthetase [Geobacteraceae bacterium GWC2_58_44]HBG07975.1 panthothenate synthetase [Geobacter sp.]